MISRVWLLWIIARIDSLLQYNLRNRASNRGMVKAKNQHRDDSLERNPINPKRLLKSKSKKCKSFKSRNTESLRLPSGSPSGLPSGSPITSVRRRELSTRYNQQETLIVPTRRVPISARSIQNLFFQTQDTIVVSSESSSSMSNEPSLSAESNFLTNFLTTCVIK